MNPPAIVLTFSATKALAHVLRLPGSDVRPCTCIIPKIFMLGYKDLYSKKMKVICSQSNNKNSMTDSIENIQERTAAGSMSVASAGVCLVAVSVRASKRGVLVYVYYHLVPLPLFFFAK
jgi:hypothetical protein